MNTEAALRCGWDAAVAPYCITPGADFPTTKAYYIAQLYAATIAEGVDASIYYSVRGDWLKTYLVDPDDPSQQAYVAYQVASDSLAKTTFSRKIEEYTGVRGYELNFRGGRIWVILSADGFDHSIDLPSQPDSAWDPFGNAVTIPGTTLTVGISPVYLRWVP